MTDQELITIERQNALTAFETGDGLDDIVRRARDTVESFEHDMSTKAGRARTASLAHKVAQFKVKLDKLGKDLVSERKAQIKLVDDNRRKMRDELDRLKTEARKPLNEWEEDEGLRIDNIKGRITNLHDLLNFDFANDLSTLEERLNAAESQVIDSSYMEFETQAHKVKEKVVSQLGIMIAQEKNRLLLERLRAEKESKIEKEAIQSLVEKGFDRGQAISFINEVSAGNVKHVTINY